MKRNLTMLLTLLLLAVATTSCNTQQRALNQMRSLTYEIENRGSYYTPNDWRSAYEDYQRIEDRIDGRRLTDEEQREYGEMKGRCLAAFAKCQVETVTGAVRNYLNQGSGLLKGIMESFGLQSTPQ